MSKARSNEPSHAQGKAVVERDHQREQIRAAYAQVAQASDEGGGCGVESGCCGVSDEAH